MDRIDIQVEVPSLKYSELDEQEPSEPSSVIRKRVNSARAIQHERFKKNGIYCNSQMTAPMIRRFCRLDKESSALLKEAFSRLSLTARSYNRILKVARTIADLDGTAEIEAVHIAEAIQYRALERGFFA